MIKFLKAIRRKLINRFIAAQNSYERFSVALRRRFYMRSIDTIPDLQERCREFEQMRAQIRCSGTEDLHYFGNGYTHEGGLYLQQNPDEFAALCLFLKERGSHANYVEIGSASGGTCLFLCQQLGFKQVLSLDDGKHPRAVEQKKNFSQIENFKQFVGDSHSQQASKFLKDGLSDELLDVAFIDGDHSYKGVSQDISLVLPFVHKGTLLVFHDTIACEDVEKAWLQCVQGKIVKPLAEYIGEEKPLGIVVGEVL